MKTIKKKPTVKTVLIQDEMGIACITVRIK
jgi:hypothetical protein